MDAFLKTLQTLPEASELIARVENGGCPAVLTGTAPVQRAWHRRCGGRRDRAARSVPLRR